MCLRYRFLDSSQLRSSVVSHAKTLGYTTRSATAAKAVVDVFLNTSNTSATMPAGTVFTSSVGDTSYQFVTIQSVTASLTGSSITFDNVDIYEGSFVSSRYTADTQNVEQRFIINDDRADTTTISITVQNSASDTTSNTYTLATDIAGLTPTDSNFIVGDGSNFVTETGATARTSLGLGSIATQEANNVSITGGAVTGLGSPSANSDAATKDYVDQAVAGLRTRIIAECATTANKNLTNGLETGNTIDGCIL